MRIKNAFPKKRKVDDDVVINDINDEKGNDEAMSNDDDRTKARGGTTVHHDHGHQSNQSESNPTRSRLGRVSLAGHASRDLPSSGPTTTTTGSALSRGAQSNKDEDNDNNDMNNDDKEEYRRLLHAYQTMRRMENDAMIRAHRHRQRADELLLQLLGGRTTGTFGSPPYQRYLRYTPPQ